MKFLNWMQCKLNVKQGGKQPVVVSKNSTSNVGKQETRKDEFSDWPHGLLTIGTFGNSNDQPDFSSASSSSRKNYTTTTSHNQIEEEEEEEEEGEIHPSSSPEVDVDQLDITPEEVGKLQEVLKKLLSRKPKQTTVESTTSDECRTGGSGRRRGGSTGSSIMNLPLDKFLNCPSSLEVDRKIDKNSISNDNNNNNNITEEEYRTSDLRRSLSLITNMAKNLSPERSTKAIKKKSISFLLKKMFVCRSGFPTSPVPPPSFRDSIPESRIEKLLRAIINKNMYTRSSGSPAASTAAKKYLENGHSYIMNKADDEDHYREDDEEEEEINQDQQVKEKIVNEKGCKWDKTDNDFIVLEI